MIAGGYDAALYGVVYSLEIRDELLAAFARGGWLSPDDGPGVHPRGPRAGRVRAAGGAARGVPRPSADERRR